jgi:hypothetical protein
MAATYQDGELVRRSSEYYRPGAQNERWARIASFPDYDVALASYDWAGALSKYHGRDPIAILDCGCGLGHFPRQLQDKVAFPPGITIHYDALDISPWSLARHRENLRPPFRPRHSFCVAIEDFRPEPGVGPYEVIWCMHSLHTVPSGRLADVITTLASLLAPDGRCFIYLPRQTSAYVTLLSLYLKEADHGQGQPYLTAEEVLAELAGREQLSAEASDCSLDHWIGAAEPQALAAYLNQACLRPDALTFLEWQLNPTFSAYLDASFDRERRSWRFRQELSLVTFTRR